MRLAAPSTGLGSCHVLLHESLLKHFRERCDDLQKVIVNKAFGARSADVYPSYRRGGATSGFLELGSAVLLTFGSRNGLTLPEPLVLETDDNISQLPAHADVSPTLV